MNLKRNTARIGAALAITGLLAACGGSGDDAARQDYGFDGSKDVPFSLTVRTGKVAPADATQTLTTASGDQTVTLGQATCVNTKNGDEAFPVTIKGHIKNPTGDLNLEVKLSVADPDHNILNVDSSRTVAVAWMYKNKATCQTTREDGISATLKGAKDGPDAQIQGFIVLPGGAGNYDGYKLNVWTDAGEVYNLKGNDARSFDNKGATVDLLP